VEEIYELSRILRRSRRAIAVIKRIKTSAMEGG